MSKTNIIRYLSELYGAVNVLCLKINFASDQRKLRLPAFESGIKLGLFPLRRRLRQDKLGLNWVRFFSSFMVRCS